MELVKRLDEIGFERTRRATAALALSLFAILYLLFSLNAPPEWGKAFAGLALCYLVAFFGVAAEWFWGRWFASGLGWSGVMVAIASLLMIGWTPPLAIYGGVHLVIVLALMGKKMAARYDMQEAWRARYRMDDFGVARLRKTVTRAAASLPSVILWALGPKEPGQGMVLAGAGVLAAIFAVAGLRGVIRLRSWGLLALAASGALLLTVGAMTSSLLPVSVDGLNGGSVIVWRGALLGAVLLAAAVAPFVRPAFRYLRERA
jgi:hypothetical protein